MFIMKKKKKKKKHCVFSHVVPYIYRFHKPDSHDVFTVTLNMLTVVLIFIFEIPDLYFIDKLHLYVFKKIVY